MFNIHVIVIQAGVGGLHHSTGTYEPEDRVPRIIEKILKYK